MAVLCVLMGPVCISFPCTEVSTLPVRQWKLHNIFKVHDVELQLRNQTAVAKTSPEPHNSTGLLISPSGISELDCATTKTDTAERSISIGR